MNVHSCPLFTDLRIDELCLDKETCLRLREMGIGPGRVVQVTQRAGFGGRVLAAGQQRFALDAATARKLVVSPAISPAR